MNQAKQRIAVMGAGAVGCYFGALLAKAGHEVVLIARPTHVDQIKKSGLRLETRTKDEQIHLKASTDPKDIAGADMVLFSVKSTDTATAAREISQHLAKDALVLTLQNGVDNDTRLRELIPHEVAAAVVYVATEMAGPGHVRHHGRGELVIATSPQSAAAAQLLTEAGIPTEVSDNVRGALWAKLILNCAYNALSAITGLPYGELVKQPGMTDGIADVVAECRAVAQADGVTVPGDIDAAVRAIATTMPGQHSSTAQDLMRGKPTEIDYLNGHVVRRGEALGIATPGNRLLLNLVKTFENKRQDGKNQQSDL